MEFFYYWFPIAFFLDGLYLIFILILTISYTWDKNKVFYLEKNLVNRKLRVKENERTPSITKGKCI